MGSDLILIIVVVTGVAFDFTNGFHDTANAAATSIATGGLNARVRRDMSSTRVIDYAIAGLCGVQCVGAVAIGLYASSTSQSRRSPSPAARPRSLW